MERGGEGAWIGPRRVTKIRDGAPPGVWLWTFTVDTSSLGVSVSCNIFVFCLVRIIFGLRWMVKDSATRIGVLCSAAVALAVMWRGALLLDQECL